MSQIPYVLSGDVKIECGPIVNDDQLIAHLRAEHGNLKKASIHIIESKPCGPPGFEALRIIYIVGKISKFTGPVQRDRSKLRATILDLGVNQEQLAGYFHGDYNGRTEIPAIPGEPGYETGLDDYSSGALRRSMEPLPAHGVVRPCRNISPSRRGAHSHPLKD